MIEIQLDLSQFFLRNGIFFFPFPPYVECGRGRLINLKTLDAFPPFPVFLANMGLTPPPPLATLNKKGRRDYRRFTSCSEGLPFTKLLLISYA